MAWVALGVIAIIVLRQWVPIFTSVLAMGLTVAVGLWAYLSYRSGATVTFAGQFVLPEILVYGLLLSWFGLEAKTLAREIKMRDLGKILQDAQDHSDPDQ
ncbi:MAG: hypothetical protein AAFY60_02865 [Myxococcota bacterium]